MEKLIDLGLYKVKSRSKSKKFERNLDLERKNVVEIKKKYLGLLKTINFNLKKSLGDHQKVPLDIKKHQIPLLPTSPP